MPIYEYRCGDCARVFPRLQRVGASSEGVTCPHCDSGTVERLVSSFASARSAGASPQASVRACGPST